MKFNKLHNALVFLLCAAALVACNKTPVQNGTDQSGKSPIVLSIGGVDSQNQGTKAVITDDSEKTYNPFSQKTKIFMVMKSEYGTEDYLGTRKDKYTVCRGDVAANQTAVTFDDLNQKYWDDAHARSSMLNIWAYAAMVPDSWNSCTFQIPNPSYDPSDPLTEYTSKTYETGTEAADKSPYPWIEHSYSSGDKGSKGAIYPCIMEWSVTNTPWSQTTASVMYQDLMFSNNLADNGVGKDKRLKFGTQQAGKFDAGEMKFYHAMSKITIKIIEGDGFDKSSPQKDNDFQFASGTNIKLTEINTKGTFNIKNGQFEMIDPTNGHQPITKIAQETLKGIDPNPYYTLQALAIPNIYGINGSTDSYSRFVPGSATTMMEFTIDNNTYKISSGDLYTALHGKTGATEKTDNGTYIPLEAGKNYIFTFKISKTKVGGITAKVADWESVTAEQQEPSNARISLKLEERGAALADADVVDIYRAANVSPTIRDDYESYAWETGYTASGDKNVYRKESGAWKLSDLWFWPNNETFYHFRAVMPTETAVTTDTTPNPDVDYFAINSADASSYTDYRWGATMLDDGDNETEGTFKWNYGPVTNGFDGLDTKEASAHQIYKAIGPTTGTIKFVLFHMMSDVTINITTTTGSDAVNIGDNGVNKTQVYIEDAFLAGRVLLGNGLVQTTGTTTASQEVSQSSFTAATGDPVAAASAEYKYGIVPQNLATSVNDSKGVQLRVVTPDNNQYYVNLKDAKVTSVETQNIANPYTKGSDNKYTITRWYPGFKYIYNLTLKKSGILDLTATIVNWEKIEATYDDVTIQ